MLLSIIYRRGNACLAPSTDLLQGTLDLLILRTLALEPMHGWGSSSPMMSCRSARALSIPPLHRLEQQGWIRADWGTSDNNRRACYYLLTRIGRKRLEAELATWDRLSTAVALVLRGNPLTP